MAEYIDRGAVIKRLKELHFDCKDFHLCGGVLLELNAIEAIAAADVVEVRHGKWIEMQDEFGTYYKCSKFGKEFYLSSLARQNYCQYCGAKMDREGAE